MDAFSWSSCSPGPPRPPAVSRARPWAVRRKQATLIRSRAREATRPHTPLTSRAPPVPAAPPGGAATQPTAHLLAPDWAGRGEQLVQLVQAVAPHWPPGRGEQSQPERAVRAGQWASRPSAPCSAPSAAPTRRSRQVPGLLAAAARRVWGTHPAARPPGLPGTPPPPTPSLLHGTAGKAELQQVPMLHVPPEAVCAAHICDQCELCAPGLRILPPAPPAASRARHAAGCATPRAASHPRRACTRALTCCQGRVPRRTRARTSG